MKGSILPNHIPVNKYSLLVLGLPTQLTPITVSGLEEELETVDLPDRTKASGGNTKSQEFTIAIPAHHHLEVSAMESWFRQGQDPVSFLYKKAGNLTMKPIGPGPGRVRQLAGMFVTKRKEADLELANEGEMAVIEYTISVDEVR